jgi:O-antigen/teichoic acid export membrane protein
VTGQGGPQPSEFTPAATSDDAAAATGSGAGDTQPRVGLPNDEQGQQAWQEWAEIDASGTMPLPVIPAVPAPLADVTATSPQSDSSTGSRRSPWKTLRTRHQKTESPAVVGEDFAELSQQVPPLPAGDGASVTVEVPTFEAAAGPAPADEEIPPEPARAEVPVTVEQSLSEPAAGGMPGPAGLESPAGGADDAARRAFPAADDPPAGDPPKPGPYANDSAAITRARDLARRRCLRLRCTCVDPLICPSFTEIRKPAQPHAQAPLPPAQPERQDPGLTSLMARAVGSAATTPIPVVRAGTDYPVDAAATTPLPVVPSGRLPRADATATQPQEQAGKQRSLWKTLRGRLHRSEMPAPGDTVQAGLHPGETAAAGPGNEAPPMSGNRAPGDTRPDMFPAPPRASGQAKSGPEMFPAPPRARAPADTRPDMFPAPRAGAPGAAPRAVPGQDQDDWVPLKPRPYVGARAASQREKDLARRSCLRIRCTCADPTICPAIAVKRKPASEAPAMGWQMPAAEQVRQPGFTTLMSLAVASAATMPIPMVPGALAYPFSTAGTMPLPVVPADVGWPKPRNGADAGRSRVGKLLARLQSDHMLRNALFLILSTGLQAALGFAFWIVVARLFSTADVGIGSSLISATGLIAYLALLGLNNALVRFLPTAPDRNALITVSMLTVAGCGTVLGAIYIFGTPIFAPKVAFVAHRPTLALGFVLLTAAAAVNLLTDSVFIASRRASYTALTDGGVGGIAKIGLAFALIGAGAYGLFSASVGGFAAASLASLVLMATALRWRPSVKKPMEILKPLLKFSGANYAGNVMALLPTLVVPLIILDRLGASAEAYYFVAFQLANLLYAAGSAVEQTFLAEGSQADVDWRNLLRRSLRLLVALFLPMCLVVVVAAHWVLLAFGVKYSQHGTPTLILLAVAAVPIGANDWLQTVLRLAGALRAIVWSGIVSAVAVCALAWFLAPYGLTALTASWAIGSSLGAVVAGVGFVAVRRREQPRERRHGLKGHGRAPSDPEGRHGHRQADEDESVRTQQPVG